MAAVANAPDWIDRLVQSVRGLRESRQRVARVVEALQTRTADEVAFFLHQLSEESEKPRHLFRRLHLDILSYRPAIDRLGYDFLSEVYRAAAQQNWNEVMILLRTQAFPKDQREIMPEGYRSRLRALTLGERRQLSRKQSRKDLELLLFDADPRVIRELLLNPRIIERDVVRIAARHQAPAEVLEEICKSARWISKPMVRRALIFNPHTPIGYSLGLIHHLTKPDLRFLIRIGSSRREFIELAKRKLERS